MAITDNQIERLIGAIQSLSPSTGVRRYRIEVCGLDGREATFVVEAYTDDEASREALRRFYDCEGQIRSVRPALETDCWACGGSTDARLFCASCGWTRDKQIEIMRTGRTT